MRRPPTAERTLHPASMFTESLTPRPELENDQDPKLTLSEPLLDRVVGDGEQSRWNRQPEHLSGLEVED